MIGASLPSLSMPLLDTVTPHVRFVAALLTGIAGCLYLSVVAFLHRRRLEHVPIRIHVAGTRGKSTAVRLVAAGLRAGGYRVVAKTTGTEPRLILPDGSERPIRRWGAPSIREQLGLVAAASREKADAIVAEAMAIEPEYLGALERFYIRATDLLITNVRPDHQEQLGTNPDAMAHAIAQALPPGGRVFATAEAAVPLLRERANALGCRLSVATVDDESGPDEANASLAHMIFRHYGIDDAAATAAMRDARQDAGVFSLKPLRVGGRAISFANAFSCNDIDSFTRLWRRHQPPAQPAAFLFNARTDRPLRSRIFFELLAQLAPDAPLYITQGSTAIRRWAVKAGFDPGNVHLLQRAPASQQLERIGREIADGTVIWGTGNFKGAGADISALANASASQC